jgi:hypothetical protein
MLGDTELTFPESLDGALRDFSEKVNSVAGSEWERQFKEFLRKEIIWPKPVASTTGLLIPVGTTTVPGTTTLFVARDRFVLNTKKGAPVKISYLRDNFKSWFLRKEEQPSGGSTLKYGKLSRYSADGPILNELGGEAEAETTLTELFSLMQAQKDGGNGPLLTNGYANIFYIKDTSGVLRAVNAYWNDNIEVRLDAFEKSVDVRFNVVDTRFDAILLELKEIRKEIEVNERKTRGDVASIDLRVSKLEKKVGL